MLRVIILVICNIVFARILEKKDMKVALEVHAITFALVLFMSFLIYMPNEAIWIIDRVNRESMLIEYIKVLEEESNASRLLIPLNIALWSGVILIGVIVGYKITIKYNLVIILKEKLYKRKDKIHEIFNSYTNYIRYIRLRKFEVMNC